MYIIEWYLDKVTEYIPGRVEKMRVREEIRTHLLDHVEELMDRGLSEQAACKEAVDAMGSNTEELAEQLALLHPYDSQKGYLFCIGMLWFGVLFLFLQVGDTGFAMLEKAVGQVLVLAALFRLQIINKKLKQAFQVECIIFITRVLSFASEAIPANYAVIAIPFFSILQCVEIICLARILYYCFAEWFMNDREGKSLIGKLLLLVYAAKGLGAVCGAAALFTGEKIWTIHVSSPLPVLIIAPVLVAGTIAFVYWSWKLKRKLQLLDDIGIEPVAWKKAGILIAAGIVFCFIPFAVSAAISLRPLTSVSVYQEIGSPEDNEEILEAKQQILACSAEIKMEQTFEQGGIWKDDVEEMLNLLPKEELQLLAGAEEILFSRDTLEDNLGEVIVFMAKYSEEKRQDIRKLTENEPKRYRSGCMITMKAPYEGYIAASGYFAAEKDMIPMEMEKIESLLFYEKGGTRYIYQPDREEKNNCMRVVSYPLKRGSERTCFYQAFSFSLEGEVNVLYSVCQNSVQHNLINIPYSSFGFDSGLQNCYTLTGGVKNSVWDSAKQGNGFIPGTAMHTDGSVWKERGMLFHFK